MAVGKTKKKEFSDCHLLFHKVDINLWYDKKRILNEVKIYGKIENIGCRCESRMKKTGKRFFRERGTYYI